MQTVSQMHKANIQRARAILHSYPDCSGIDGYTVQLDCIEGDLQSMDCMADVHNMVACAVNLYELQHNDIAVRADVMEMVALDKGRYETTWRIGCYQQDFMESHDTLQNHPLRA